MTLLIFGFGFTGKTLAARALARGQAVTATARKAEDRAAAEALGVQAVDPADADTLMHAVAKARAILVTAPPGERGCPGLEALAPAIAASGQPALGEACLDASRRMIRQPPPPAAAIRPPARRAGARFIPSSVRAAAQPKLRQRGSLWPIMLSAVLTAL
jgi:saccharopine dehydrogenase-like NADP-dependent oxidoreductase